MEEMKKKEERLEKQMAEVMAENKRLVEPLQKAREEVDELRKQLANYDKDKQSLAVSIPHTYQHLLSFSCLIILILMPCFKMNLICLLKYS